MTDSGRDTLNFVFSFYLVVIMKEKAKVSACLYSLGTGLQFNKVLHRELILFCLSFRLS